MNELVRVDMSEFGLTETKAAEVRKAFDLVLTAAADLENDFNKVSAMEISPETCAKAKALRLKYVKVRTSIAAVHKDQKAFYLSGGRAVDGIKNAYTHAVIGNEEKLKEIETHYDRIEAERKAKLQEDRQAAIAPYIDADDVRDFSALKDDEFSALLEMKKIAFEDRIAAEKKAESDRIAKEKAEAEERERIRKENERLKKEAEAREKAEKKRIAKAAAEKKRIEAEREKERKEAEAKLAKERKERERIEAEQKAKAAAEKKAQQEKDAREKDKEHRRLCNNEALAGLIDLGLNREIAINVITAIAGGKIKRLSLSY